MKPGAGRIIAQALLLLALAAAPRAQEEQPPADIGLQEEVGITLMILDVDARDPSGEPLVGLTAEDFSLTLGATPWTIYAVDDLCPCSAADTAGRFVEAATPPADPGGSGAPAPAIPGPAANPLMQQRFILYFDFSQMRPDGRDRAFRAAERWLAETKRPRDQVELVAFVSRGGLEVLSDFTRDTEALLRVLRAAEDDLEYFDDFPARIFERRDDCALTGNCIAYAVEEYQHSQRSLRTLRQFLLSLQDVPGRKEFMYFNQNNVPRPGRLYGQSDFRIGTNLDVMEEVGAAATASGARIHALSTDNHRTVGSGKKYAISDEAANLGFNLADYSGGTYSQASSELATLMDRPVKECSCRYRISFEPPTAKQTRMFNARVAIRGQRLPYSFRIELLTRTERLMREYTTMLEFPGSRRDFPVHVTLVPSRRTRKGWDVTASVLARMDDRWFARVPDGLRASLDVGAILSQVHEHGGGKSYEMFGGSRIRLAGSPTTEQWLVHRHEFSSLPAGRYRLAGFIHDGEMDLAGGSASFITLPRVKQSGLVGPFLYQPRCRYYRSDLPTRKDGEAERTTAIRGIGPLPMVPEIPQGEEILLVTWSCGPHNQDMDLDLQHMTRQIVRQGAVLDTLELPHFIAAEENCLKVIDSLETTRLAPGEYEYAVAQTDGDGETVGTLNSSLHIVIREPESSAAGADIRPPGDVVAPENP